MERFVQALAALLPTGFAWPRDVSSVWMRVLRGLAGSFASLHDDIAEVVRQWQPHHAVARLAEWEGATGLPDKCFVLPAQLLAPGLYDYGPGDLAAFSRASVGTYFDAAGVLQTAGVDVPRFDHDPVTLAPKGLLVEAAATNPLRYSQQLDGPVWNKANAPITADAAIAPDGTLTADKAVPTVTLVAHQVEHFEPNFIEIGTNTQSWFVKAAGYDRIFLWWPTGGVGATFDLTAGTKLNDSNGTGTITPLANGWYRVTHTLTTVALQSSVRLYICQPGTTGANVWTVAADGVSGVLVWGAQIDNGPVATSYIPTTTTAVTRAADLAYIPPPEAEQQALRRKLLLARLRGPVLKYDDSSPASPGAIVAICAWVGYQAEVRYNTPFRCGRQVGQPLGALDGKLYIIVTLQSRRFRVGMSRVGSRLLEGDLNGGELACYLQRIVPARYSVNVIFV